VTALQLLGKPKISGADVVIVDDMIDSGKTLKELSDRLHADGARNIYLCASHGLFTEKSMELIDDSHIKKVVITNSLPLPLNCSPKIEQLSIAPEIAAVILAEYFRRSHRDDEEIFKMEDGDD